MIFNKLGLLGVCVAALCSASPIEYIFTGTGTGSVGNTTFSDAPFTIEFFTDTGALVYGTTACGDYSANCSTPSSSLSCCTDDASTPNPTMNNFLIGTDITGSIASSAAPSVFLNPMEENVGIWTFGSPDYLPSGNPTFATYNFTSDLGPVGVQAFSNVQLGNTTGIAATYSVDNGATSTGDLSFTTVSDVSFQAILTSGTSGTSGASGSGSGPVGPAAVTPEPSTFLMIGLGMLVFSGKLRKKRV